MNLNKLMESISNALYSEFGSEYKVYTENIEQGLTEPCFFVKYIEPSQAEALSTRIKSINSLQVRFHPIPSRQENKDCNDVADRLYGCLKIISYDNHKIRGTNLHHVISDGVLVFMINYDYHLDRPVYVPQMEKLEISNKLKV